MKAGLSNAEATQRREQDGPNAIRQASGPSLVQIFVRQFRGPMVALLAAAALLSGLLGELLDAIAIAVILLVNGVLGFAQENRAERALDALRAMTAPRAHVRRGGKDLIVPAADVVVGDLLVLDAGDLVSADARVVEAQRLTLNEASLTGESAPVHKSTQPVPEGAALAEQNDRVFFGTAVCDGSGLAEVAAIGMNTELGKIASLLEESRPEATPLEKRLEQVGRSLAIICIVVAAVVALAGLLRGDSALTVLMAGVALAVAAVPEGLGAVVTIALAVGIERMSSLHVLVRRLPAVETLGCATVICTDKTGTLTTGRMRLREVWGEDRASVLAAAAACVEADIGAAEGSDPSGEEGTDGIGDPTEIALLLGARELGIERANIESSNPRVSTNPFDSDRKRMSVYRSDRTLYVKGAPDAVVPRCRDDRSDALAAAAEMGSRGLRVLAVALGDTEEESDLRLVGLVGLADPPRTDAAEAVRAARAAGVRTVMITGDHEATATAIARELGIVRPGDDLSETVHWRATPQDKIDIVRRWKARGDIVAMTGDGVNDAPALKEAHIGIAMGVGGTEVARQASAMVLTDDRFSSIVAAIREGRGIFDNIRKTLVYLLAGNVGELLVMLGAALVGLPLPLTALQILWVNLVTDGLPALALAVDPTDDDVLARPPRAPTEPILGRPQWRTIVTTGALQAFVVLGAYSWALAYRDLHIARNIAFSTLVFGELFRAFSARSRTRTLFEVGALSNARLLLVVLVSALVQVGLHHIPATQSLFGIGAISLGDCALTIGLGLIPVTLLELYKLAKRGLAVGPRAVAAAALLGIALLVAPVSGQDSLPAPLSLADAARLARERRSEVDSATARAEAAARRPAIVSVPDDPRIEARILHQSVEREMFPTWFVMVSQSFPLGDVLGSRARAAEADARRLSHMTAAVELDVELQAATAFLALHYARLLDGLLVEQVSLTQQLLAAAHARYAAGVGRQTDVLRAQAELARLVAHRAGLVGETAGAEGVLLATLNVAGDQRVPTLVPPRDTLTELQMRAALGHALHRRPELAAADELVVRYDRGVDEAEASRLPSMTLGLGSGWNPAGGAGITATVGLTIPLFLERRDAAVDEARSMSSMARDEREALARVVESQVAASLGSLRGARARRAALRQEVVPAARQAVDSALAQYGAGEVTQVTVIEALRALFGVETELVAAQIQSSLAEAHAMRAIGREESVDE